MDNNSNIKRPKLSVFVPLGNCTCMYSHFMDRVTKIILPYRDKFEFEVKSTDSPEADKYELFQMAVVIENHPGYAKPLVIINLNNLEEYLNEL